MLLVWLCILPVILFNKTDQHSVDQPPSQSFYLKTHLKNTLEKSQPNVTTVTLHPSSQTIWPDIWIDTVEKSQKMQPMRICILSGRQFEETFEKVQWGKVELLQLVWLCILSVMPFEDTFEKHTGEKPNKCNKCDLAYLQANNLARHLNRHSGGKPKM